MGETGGVRDRVRHPQVAESAPMEAIRHFLDQHPVGERIPLLPIEEAEDWRQGQRRPPANGSRCSATGANMVGASRNGSTRVNSADQVPSSTGRAAVQQSIWQWAHVCI